MHKFIQNPYPPPKPPTWRNHQTPKTSNPEKSSNRETSNPKKSSNPHEKPKARNLKQINTHRENKNQVRKRVIWLVLFPTLLATKHTKKIIISFNFITLYQTRSVTHMLRLGNGAPMRWCWARVMEAMHVPIYFECYNVHDDMKKVPKEFMNSIRKNKVVFRVDRRKSVVLLGHGFLVWSLVSFAMGLSFVAKGLEWIRSKREIETERIQGAGWLRKI